RGNRKARLAAWKLDPAVPQATEAVKLLDSMDRLLDHLNASDYRVTARAVTARAITDDRDNLIVNNLTLPMLRQQRPGKDGHTLCITDFINPDGSDIVTLFAVTAPEITLDNADDYTSLLLQSVCHRLAEAATERLHRDLSGFTDSHTGIRPAVGYPMLPDQSLVHELDRQLHYGQLGISITEHGALHPSATTTGLIIYSPDARYFDVGPIDREQLADYADRRGQSPESTRPYLEHHTRR
ncbi:MAG: hypothetical protein K2L41_04500, partial [Muribaculaceae bacterium]|nr:hypothetical protein [Muribaculaceae bacterium]